MNEMVRISAIKIGERHRTADPAFIDDTAAKTGRSRTVVAEDIQFATAIKPTVREWMCERCGVEHESIRNGFLVDVREVETSAGNRIICGRCEQSIKAWTLEADPIAVQPEPPPQAIDASVATILRLAHGDCDAPRLIREYLDEVVALAVTEECEACASVASGFQRVAPGWAGAIRDAILRRNQD